MDSENILGMEKQPYRTRNLRCRRLQLTEITMVFVILSSSVLSIVSSIWLLEQQQNVPQTMETAERKQNKTQTWGLYGLIGSLLIPLSCGCILIFADGCYLLWWQECAERLRQSDNLPMRTTSTQLTDLSPWPDPPRYCRYLSTLPCVITTALDSKAFCSVMLWQQKCST